MIYGREALKKAEQSPDLILLDVAMPEMDGGQGNFLLAEEKPPLQIVDGQLPGKPDPCVGLMPGLPAQMGLHSGFQFHIPKEVTLWEPKYSL